jgi:hypothetical protein
VTIFASRPHHVGKEHLAKHAIEEWPELVNELSNIINKDSKALIVTQKRTKDIIAPFRLPCTEQSIGHWGNLDGKNEWRDYDTAVIFGLPYPDDILPTDIFHACTGLWSDDWFASRRAYGDHQDIKAAIRQGIIARSVIQAICRVRCRTIVDKHGNCAPTKIFIRLPSGVVGDVVLDAIQNEMPGSVVIQSCEFPEITHSLTRSEQRLFAVLRDATPGVHSKTSVIERLSINSRTFDRMSAKLRREDAGLARALADIGVEFRCTRGRGREAHFIKQ